MRNNLSLRLLLADKDKEIERLEESQLAYLQVDKDKQRLHTIINEYNSKCNSTIYEGRAFEDSVILHKIKELKEGDKEDYYKYVGLEYIERINDIVDQDKKVLDKENMEKI